MNAYLQVARELGVEQGGDPMQQLVEHAKRWAARALELHRGEHVAYVGEGEGGCTADDDFHGLLDELYEQVQAVEIPQWPGLRDWLTIWRRRG